MTPGVAKTRADLPYLYYPRNDRVIINAHNFTSAFNPAVNGKSPASVWCPSRDTAGNGTTTLNDLVGSYSGAFSGMTGSAWVADTDAGGVRAISFDGVDDHVLVSSFPAASLSSGFSISFWAKANFAWGGTAATRYPFGYGSNENIGVTNQHVAGSYSGAFFMRGNGTYPVILMSSPPGANVWVHIVIVWTGTTMRLYKNGTLQGSVSNSTFASTPGTNLTFGRGSASSTVFPGRMDDIRLFSAITLDASDVSFLYGSGLGRGVSA